MDFRSEPITGEHKEFCKDKIRDSTLWTFEKLEIAFSKLKNNATVQDIDYEYRCDLPQHFHPSYFRVLYFKLTDRMVTKQQAQQKLAKLAAHLKKEGIDTEVYEILFSNETGFPDRSVIHKLDGKGFFVKDPLKQRREDHYLVTRQLYNWDLFVDGKYLKSFKSKADAFKFFKNYILDDAVTEYIIAAEKESPYNAEISQTYILPKAKIVFKQKK